jgi:hypothetical protein
MRKTPILAAWILALMAMMPFAIGADYHVALGGDDSAPGSATRPFATIPRAQTAVRQVIAAGLSQPVTVWIHNGTHRLAHTLAFGPSDSGDARFSIQYRCWPGDDAAVSGALAIGGWRTSDGAVWTTTVPGSVIIRQLLVDGKPAFRAASPSQTSGPAYWSLSSSSLASDRSTYRVTFAEGAFASWTRVADVELANVGAWDCCRFSLTAVDPATRTVSIGQPILSYQQHPNNRPAGGTWTNSWARLENAREFLDQPGEWCFDSATRLLAYRPRAGEDLTRAQVDAPMLDRLIDFVGTPETPVVNVHVVGLRLLHAHLDGPANYYGFQSGAYSLGQNSWAKVPAAIAFRHARSCSLSGCEIAFTDGAGCWFGDGARYDRVEFCHIHDIGGNGVDVGSTSDPGLGSALLPIGNRISDNRIHGCGRRFEGSVGIWSGFSDHTQIVNNEVSDIPYSGISLGWNWGTGAGSMRNALVQDNHIHAVMTLIADGAGLYTIGYQPGATLRGNWIHDVRRGPFSSGAGNHGIFFDQGSSGFTVTGNLVYATNNVTAVKYFRSQSTWQTLSGNTFGGTPTSTQVGAATARTAQRPDLGLQVALTTPRQNSEFVPGSVLAIEAAAASFAGTVAKVEFLVDGAKVGEDAQAPYAVTWNAVSAGNRTLVARAIDARGSAVDSVPITIAIGTGFGHGDGLNAMYYDNADFTGSSVSRIDPFIDYDFWGTGSPATGISSDSFSVRWSGFIEPPTGDTYTFTTSTDDGARLWIDDQLIVDHWGTGMTRDATGSIALQAGRRYRLRMDYFEDRNSASARLSWSTPTMSKRPVPRIRLYTRDNAPPSVAIIAPGDGATFSSPATVGISATASDDGGVARVEFFAGSSKLGEDFDAPFSLTWSGAAPGNYALTVRATDDTGVAAVSVPITVTIVDPSRQGPYGGGGRAIAGRIQAEDYDDGGEGVAYHDYDAANLGGQYRSGEGVDLSTSSAAGGIYLSATNVGEWLEYTVDIAAAGTYGLSARLSSPYAFGRFHLDLDGSAITPLLVAPTTGGWQVWQAVGFGEVTLPAGRHVLRLAMDNSGFNLDWLEFTAPTPSGFATKINFQPAAAAPVAGYLVDSGGVFADRNGLRYGWNLATPDTRDRGALTDQLRDTLILMQAPANPSAYWDIEVPPGSYEVRAVCGDPSFFDGNFKLDIEGVRAIDARATSAVPFAEGTVTVPVNDGRLTITNGTGSYNTKLCFIEILRVPGGNG